MERTNPIIQSHLNLKTYFGEDYEVYKDCIIFKDSIIEIPGLIKNFCTLNSSKDRYTFELGTANYCNLNCKYCFANHNNPHKFNAKENIELIEKLKENFGQDKNYAFYLNSDGEILNNPRELKKVIDYLNLNNYAYIIRTNGYYKNLLKIIKYCGLKSISISYDGLNDKNRIHKKNITAPFVRENIDKLIKDGVLVQTNTVVNQDSSNLYDDVIDLKNAGVQKIMITLEKNKLYSISEAKIILDNFKDFFTRVFSDFINNQNFIFEFLSQIDIDFPICTKDLSSFFKVDKNLNLSRCSYINDKIELSDILSNRESKIDLKREVSCNENCLFNNFCGGNFCYGLDDFIGCELRKLYFEFIFNIIIYYKDKSNINLKELLYKSF